MSSKASIPTELYQANVDLAVRIASLLQENGKSWIDLFADASVMNPASIWPDLRGDGQFSLEKLASLSAETAGKLFKGDGNYWKRVFSTAVQNQQNFAEGLREAVDAWQAANRKALDKAGSSVSDLLGELPGAAELFGAFKHYIETPAKAASTRTKPVASAASAPKPRKAPKAVKPATAKKASAKPAAKQPAAAKPATSKKPATTKSPAPAKKAAAKKPAANKVPLVEAPKAE